MPLAPSTVRDEYTAKRYRVSGRFDLDLLGLDLLLSGQDNLRNAVLVRGLRLVRLHHPGRKGNRLPCPPRPNRGGLSEWPCRPGVKLWRAGPPKNPCLLPAPSHGKIHRQSRWIEKLRVSKPVSRVLSWMIIYLGRQLPDASCDATRRRDGPPRMPPYSVLLQVGFT